MAKLKSIAGDLLTITQAAGTSEGFTLEYP
jgi:hypothetical protein